MSEHSTEVQLDLLIQWREQVERNKDGHAST